MRIAGVDQAIGHLVKWAEREDWAPYREEVFASHLAWIDERFDVRTDELVDRLGDAFGMLYGVILEDFFTARFGDDGECNVIDDYLKRRGWRETVPARRYLEAIRDSVLSLYEVVDLDPGKTLTVRDLIRGGDPVTVTEKLGSQTAARWDRIAARLVTVNGKPWITGGLLLLSHEVANQILPVFEDMVKTFRTELRKKAERPGEDPEVDSHGIRAMVLESIGPRLFTQAWLIDALRHLDAPLPEIRNSDGDEILFSQVRFPLKGKVAQIAAIIDGIEGFVRDGAGGPSWTWHGQGSPSRRMAASPQGGITLKATDDSARTALGDVAIRNDAVLLGTNSKERAEKGRDLLAAHLGDLAGVPVTTHEDLERLLEQPPAPRATDEGEIPPEIAAQVLRSYLDEHYRRTLDDPLPALDGETPRHAIKNKRGRARVIEWLKYLENAEYRRAARDGQQPYDMTWMWRELKLEGER